MCWEPVPLSHKWHLPIFWKYWVFFILCPKAEQARETAASSKGSRSEKQARLERGGRSLKGQLEGYPPSLLLGWYHQSIGLLVHQNRFVLICFKPHSHFCFPHKWPQAPACGQPPPMWGKLCKKDKGALLNREQTEPSFEFDYESTVSSCSCRL